MRLFELDSNPVPADAAVGSITSDDGVSLRYAAWPPITPDPRGTVCLLQGMPQTIEHQFEAVGELRSRGYAVAAFDWRSQAGSQRPLADRDIIHVDDFDEYDRDLAAFMREVERVRLPKPYFALAYSIGAAACLRHFAATRTSFERAVLLAPMVKLRHGVPISLLHLYVWLATKLGFGRQPAVRFSPHGGASLLTCDRRRFERDREIWTEIPRLANASRSFSWWLSLFRATAALRDPDFGRTIDFPILICAGTEDRLVCIEGVRELARRIPSACLLEIPGARHALLSETDEARAILWSAFDTFMWEPDAVSDQRKAFPTYAEKAGISRRR